MTAAASRARLGRRTLGRHLRRCAARSALVVVVARARRASATSAASQLAAMAYFGIAAGGLTVLTGLNGQISLGHGALMAVGAYTTALCSRTGEPVAAVLVARARRGARHARSSAPWSASPPPGCTAPTSPARRWRWPSRCRASRSTSATSSAASRASGCVLPEIPTLGARRGYFLTGSDLDPHRVPRLPRLAHAARRLRAARQPRRAAASGAAGGPCATTRSPPSSPASTSAAPGSRPSW